MDPLKKLISPKGKINGREVERRRKNDLHLTQAELVQRSGLSRSIVSKIERNKLRRHHPDTIRKLLRALELESQMELPRHLTGERWSYHWTRDASNRIVVKECRWTIQSRGACVMTYVQDDVDPESKATLLTYKGRAEIEEGTRLVFVLESTDHIPERAMWRFDEVPADPSSLPLQGAWFGVDFRRKICSGSALLSAKRLDSRAEIARQLSMISAFQAKSLSDRPEDVRMIGSWNDKVVLDAISECADGETITILTTCFSSPLKWQSCLRDLARKQAASKSPINVRLLLMDFRLQKLLDVRTRHRPDIKTKEFVANIKQQADKFVKLNRELAGGLKLEVRFYQAWPFGLCFQIGRKVIFFGLLLAGRSPIEGPQFVLADPTSHSWERLEEDLNTVWDHALEATKLLRQGAAKKRLR